jgi:CDP-diacylglycerol--glycerol-3-phosphate 3-phosphatidyltransferase
VNLPNRLTLLRIILVPVFVLVLYLEFPYHLWVGLAIFLVASITDMLDGKIARKYHLVTDFGKFMDPIADKLLVTAAMLVFVAWHWMPAWVVIVVIAREFIVSALRLVAANNGRVIAAGWSGKVKTASTMVCICLMLLGLPQWFNDLSSAIILITTAYSGIEYMVKNRDVLDWSNI